MFFDIKSDAIKTLVELGIEEKNLFVSDNTKYQLSSWKIRIYYFEI
jgi:hypothetical protein